MLYIPPGRTNLVQRPCLIARLEEALDLQHRLTTLIIDDYHLIQNEMIHKALTFLIEHQPPEMHLILATRIDPPLPLAQLRARGQITEIREQDLRFTQDKAAAFLDHVMELDPPAEAVAVIERLTEGWVASLQMAAISARGHQREGNLNAFIEAFA